jgi:hypothetical protein
VFDCLLSAAGRTVPDEGWRNEVVGVARQAAAGRGLVVRGRELGGVVAFGVRLRSVQATDGRAGGAWRQGARLGAVLLLVTAMSRQLAAGGAGGAFGAAAIAGTVVATVLGYRRAALVGGVLALATVVAGEWTVASAVAVALAALALSTNEAAPVLGGWRWLVVLLAAVIAVAAGGEMAAVVVATAATLVVPIGLVIAGGGDARLAAAAAVVWSWRFVAIEPIEVSDAVAALATGRGADVVLVRLVAMAWAVGLAVVVAHRSTRRAAL